MNIARRRVRHESLDPSSGFDSDAPPSISGRLLGNQENHDTRVPSAVAHPSGGPHAPFPSDSQGNVGYIAVPDICHRDESHLATGLCADLERNAIQPINCRRIKYASGVNNDFGGARAVPAGRCRNLDLLGCGYEYCKK